MPAGIDARRFVVFDQDHDQVGNRALGDRPSARLDDGTLAVSAALVLTSPYTPMLFMGEEWGATTPFLYFTDHQDPELAEAVRQGRRSEFSGHGWAEMYPDEAVDGELEVPDPQDPDDGPPQPAGLGRAHRRRAPAAAALVPPAHRAPCRGGGPALG